MNQLFIIKDYETGAEMYYYLTDNAWACKQALDDIDGLVEIEDYSSEDKWLEDCQSSLIDELGKDTIKQLVDIKYNDHWLKAFEKLCEIRNIKLEYIVDVATYRY